MRVILIAFGLLAAAAASTEAGEDAVKLKDGAGKQAVEANCLGCHSLDYIQMNSPFLDEKGWQAEVAKMAKAYGAPLNQADVPAIAAYLAQNYGKK
ncbi:MAG: cytochrome c [Alphaproteobacteria bacterium]